MTHQNNWSIDQKQRAESLAAWWVQLSDEEVSSLIPKAIEYGSADLEVMGQAMLTLLPNLRGVVDGQELAIAFYALGKIARLFGGYAQGERPSNDCWYDLKVYAGMAQRVREVGEWG